MSIFASGFSRARWAKPPSGWRKSFCMSTMMSADRAMSGPLEAIYAISHGGPAIPSSGVEDNSERFLPPISSCPAEDVMICEPQVLSAKKARSTRRIHRRGSREGPEGSCPFSAILFRSRFTERSQSYSTSSRHIVRNHWRESAGFQRLEIRFPWLEPIWAPDLGPVKKKRPTASCCQSATRMVRLGGHVQSGTGRVAQKIRGNHSLRKQNPHQRASYWLGPEKVNDFTILVTHWLPSGRGDEIGGTSAATDEYPSSGVAAHGRWV
jgi:hypothetical protein